MAVFILRLSHDKLGKLARCTASFRSPESNWFSVVKLDDVTRQLVGSYLPIHEIGNISSNNLEDACPVRTSCIQLENSIL